MTKLTDRAMTATLHLQAWDGRRLDRKVTEETLQRQHAAADAGKFHKLLVPKESLEPVQKAQRAARDRHYAMTLPWTDAKGVGLGGVRVLTADAFQTYMDAMDEERTKCDRAAEDFCARYPQLLQDAPLRLNGMFDKNDFPTPAAMVARFGFHLTVDPVPSDNDFRVKLADEDAAADIRRDITKRVQERAIAAERALWDRIVEALTHYANTMVNPKKTFRDTTVENLHDIARMAPKLTLLEGTEVADVCSRVLDLNYSPSNLRTSVLIRSRAAEQAQALLQDIVLVRLEIDSKKAKLDLA